MGGTAPSVTADTLAERSPSDARRFQLTMSKEQHGVKSNAWIMTSDRYL
jgi:hypothetical protein